MIFKDRTPIVVAGLLALIALLVRFIELDSHFLLIDEAFVGVAARDIAFNNTPMWDAVSNAPYVWGLAQLIQLFGDNAFVLRLPSAIFGAAVSLLLFFYLRSWAGKSIAILSAAIYAIHPFAAAFTRVAFVDALQLPTVLLSMIAVDRFLTGRDKPWLWIALASAALAFIFKYNALAILGCWMLAGLVLGRYSIRHSIIYGSLIVVASLGTLLLWPYSAPVWFFSFLAKGGSYESSYILGFYDFTFPHVTLGRLTLPIALVAYALLRSRLDKIRGMQFDHWLLFGLAYYGLLLLLGRPFQRYLLVLTVPVAILYGMILIEAYRAVRVWLGNRAWMHLVRGAAGAAALIGMLMQGYVTWTNYVHYLRNDIDVALAAPEIKKADRVLWPWGSHAVLGYYMGFDQYYSLATRGPLKEDLYRHYFNGSTTPYAADTLPYGVLIARRELEKMGLINAVINPSTFAQNVKKIDAKVDAQQNAKKLFNFYDPDLLGPNDYIVEAHGIVDQNGEPKLYETGRGPIASNEMPKGFELVAMYIDGKRYTDTSYRRHAYDGALRIMRKADAR